MLIATVYVTALNYNMSDSSLDSAFREQDPELAKVADKQLPKVDSHSAGATPDEVAPIGLKSHGVGVAIPEKFKEKK